MPRLFKSSTIFLIIPLILFFSANLLFVILAFKLINKDYLSPKQSSDYSIYLATPKDSKVIEQAYGADDARPVILDQYLTSQGAPLAGFGKKLVSEADKYGLDWRLVTAIAMQESNAGKVMPRDSYNAWGWAIFTGKNSGTYFDSWEHAIETVSRGLAKYRDVYGLITPEQIMTRYTPDSAANGGSWAYGVRFFMDLFSSYQR